MQFTDGRKIHDFREDLTGVLGHYEPFDMVIDGLVSRQREGLQQSFAEVCSRKVEDEVLRRVPLISHTAIVYGENGLFKIDHDFDWVSAFDCVDFSMGMLDVDPEVYRAIEGEEYSMHGLESEGVIGRHVGLYSARKNRLLLDLFKGDQEAMESYLEESYSGSHCRSMLNVFVWSPPRSFVASALYSNPPLIGSAAVKALLHDNHGVFCKVRDYAPEEIDGLIEGLARKYIPSETYRQKFKEEVRPLYLKREEVA